MHLLVMTVGHWGTWQQFTALLMTSKLAVVAMQPGLLYEAMPTCQVTTGYAVSCCKPPVLCLCHIIQRGNALYQSQKYKEACQAYTDALALKVDDDTFNAVLLCNRAAALHCTDQYIDALFDCCVAACLDDKYPRILQVRPGIGCQPASGSSEGACFLINIALSG